MEINVLYENEYQQVLSYPDEGIYEQRFKAASEVLFGEDYIREVKIFGEQIVATQNPESPFRKLVVNTLDGGPTMEPMVQEFMHAEFYPMLVEAGITTKAYCLGAEILSKISVELTAENDPRKQFNYKFFATLEEGLEWIRNQ